LYGQGRVSLALYGVMQGWFSAKLGSKVSDGSQIPAVSMIPCVHQQVDFHQNFYLGQKSVMDPSCQHNFLPATNSHRDITNRNEPPLFFHMDPTNSIVWTRKSFIGSELLCVMQGWFSSKLRLGSKNQ
jgi:hypothetical protein